jgi:hypothetical protein
LIGSATGLMNFGGQIGGSVAPAAMGALIAATGGLVSRGVLSVAGVCGHVSRGRHDLAASRRSGLRRSTGRHPIETGLHHD